MNETPEQPNDEEREAARRRRRRLEQVFGDALPEGTRDESPEGWGDGDAGDATGHDEWLRGQVPPHHG